MLSAPAGCGDDGRPVREHGGSVTGTVELVKPQGGPPDAGTSAGHGADLGVAITTRPTFVLKGTVTPHDSDVIVTRRRDREQVPARVGEAGKFTVRLHGLRRGLNEFTLAGRKARHDPWNLAIRITRR
jgi:hypothetical protein